jgi:hypothetical protein
MEVKVCPSPGCGESPKNVWTPFCSDHYEQQRKARRAAAEAARRERLNATPLDPTRTCSGCGGRLLVSDATRCKECRSSRPRRYQTFEPRHEERERRQAKPVAHCEGCSAELEHIKFRFCPDCRHRRDVERRQAAKAQADHRRPSERVTMREDRAVAIELRRILAVHREHGRTFEAVWEPSIIEASSSTAKDNARAWRLAFQQTHDAWRSAYLRLPETVVQLHSAAA